MCVILYFLHRQLKAGSSISALRNGVISLSLATDSVLELPPHFLPFFDLHISNWKTAFERKKYYSLEKVAKQQQQKKKG